MNKAFVFDFDDTLAITSARVIIHNSMSVAYKSVSSFEFPGYKLGNGESFDFSEFRDDMFIKNADPKLLMNLAREVYMEGHSVFILTARQNTVAAAINVWLMSHGVDATEIHCVGSDDVTHQEAGQILGVSQGTISWRVSQAKSQLRALKAQEQTL